MEAPKHHPLDSIRPDLIGRIRPLESRMAARYLKSPNATIYLLAATSKLHYGSAVLLEVTRQDSSFRIVSQIVKISVFGEELDTVGDEVSSTISISSRILAERISILVGDIEGTTLSLRSVQDLLRSQNLPTSDSLVFLINEADVYAYVSQETDYTGFGYGLTLHGLELALDEIRKVIA